jgi:hypothetical protein
MQKFILNKEKQSDISLNQDRSRDLLMFGNCEAFKREVHNFIINIIGILIVP